METKQKRTKVTVSVLVLAGLLAFSLLASGAPAALFIKFDGVDGEAQDRDHDKWCDALSFIQGISSPGTGTGSTRRRGDVVLDDIVVVKELDKASPKLAESICKGTVFPKVEIHLTASYADAGRVTYYACELKNAQIVSYCIGVSGQSEDVPAEEISMKFEEIKVTYTEHDSSGKKKGTVEYSWKVEEAES